MTLEPARHEVPVEQTWDLTPLFASTDAWEEALNAFLADLPQVLAWRGRLAEGPGALVGCLRSASELEQRLSRLFTYASLLGAEEMTNPTGQGLTARAGAAAARYSAETAFIRSELMAMPEGQLAGWLEAEPALAAFRSILREAEDARRHALSPETERALAALGEALSSPAQIYGRLVNADMRLEPVEHEGKKSVVRREMLLAGGPPDLELRRKAYREAVRGLLSIQNAAGSALGAHIRKNVVLAQLRGYSSVLEMLLSSSVGGRYTPDHLSVAAFEQVLDVIQGELAPHMRRYARLLKRRLGLEQLYLCDLAALPNPAGATPTLTWEEGCQKVLGALGVLGEEYSEIIRQVLYERGVYRAQNRGRTGGAFCSHGAGVRPYVFSGWGGGYGHLSTLAHELGHAGHMALMYRYNPPSQARTTLAFVEAPSTMNQHLLSDHLLNAEGGQPAVAAALRRMMLGVYRHNFVNHLLEAELLRRCYRLAERGQAITAAVLRREKAAILSGFWGGEVEIDEGAEMLWAVQGHYYSGLYPYTYSVGLAASTAYSEVIGTEGEAASRQWVELLKGDTSLPAAEVLLSVGIDITAPEPFRQAIAKVGRLVDQLEAE